MFSAFAMEEDYPDYDIDSEDEKWITMQKLDISPRKVSLIFSLIFYVHFIRVIVHLLIDNGLIFVVLLMNNQEGC
jgi:hypothetical protein